MDYCVFGKILTFGSLGSSKTKIIQKRLFFPNQFWQSVAFPYYLLVSKCGLVTIIANRCWQTNIGGSRHTKLAGWKEDSTTAAAEVPPTSRDEFSCQAAAASARASDRRGLSIVGRGGEAATSKQRCCRISTHPCQSQSK